MRHGIAIERTEPGCPDEPERFLTEEGMERTREAARGLRELGIKPEAALSSPFLRAMQTAEIACEALGLPKKSIVKTEALLSEADPRAIFAELGRLGAREAICFGHAPHLDYAIAAALGARGEPTSLKKAGFAALDMDSLAPPQGRLNLLLTPKALRSLAR